MESFRFRPRVERLEGDLAHLSLGEALARLRSRRAPALFEGRGEFAGRFSLLGFDPLPLAPPASLRGLRAFVQSLEVELPAASAELPPWFQGGFLGALSYDLGVDGEELDLPGDPWGFPGVVGGLYTDFLVRDHAAHTSWLVLGEDPGDDRASVAVRRAEIRSLLGAPAERRSLRALGPLVRSTSSELLREKIEHVRELIAAGEIYQANLSHRFARRLRGDPVDLYLRLRDLHPGPYLGFLRFEGGALVSGSPECLLDFEPALAGERPGSGGTARTRPIKGTATRGRTEAEDRENARRLLASEKDRAELAMIVDLERNDLGRVAQVGGVRVEAFPVLESFATVHHLVADVVARVTPGRDGVDVLAALFPGGSVTGAPKLRSMEIIAALEGEGRSFFYGSQVMLDTRGSLRASVLIRCLLWRDLGAGSGEAAYRVGGGITYGSDPAAEEEESLDKGLALAQALEP